MSKILINTKTCTTLNENEAKEDNIRNGCKDMWNAFMVKNASFSKNNDIPFCPCQVTKVPTELIGWDDAKAIYKKELAKGNIYFKHSGYIHFYMDDIKFDGKRSSIWLYPEKSLEVIKHFDGIITPDFSTYSDFPEPWILFNTYRMRAFGYWIQTQNIPVINNVRWGNSETWKYCFDGIPKNSIICVGTIASGINKIKNRIFFENGLNKMVEILEPHTILIYGSDKYSFIQNLKKRGIKIIAFESKTNLAFKKRKSHV